MPVIKIAKSGYDAETETDDRNLLFNQSNIYKIAFVGDLDVVVTYIDDGFGGTIGLATASFQHALGYVPVAFAFDKDNGEQLPSFIPVGAGVAASFSYKVDNDKIYITVNDTGVFGWTGDTLTFHFRYQIMFDKII